MSTDKDKNGKATPAGADTIEELKIKYEEVKNNIV